MPRFTIVVPVYNSQTFLKGSVGSAMRQTFDDIEILCVDDGSTDSSRAILAELAKTDKRIRVIEQPNEGPSSARNNGIESARGDFVLFLDSDDELEPETCERIAEELDGQTDAVVFGWSCFGGDTSDWMNKRGDVPDIRYPAFSPKLVFDEPTQPFLRLAVRKSALIDNDIRFDETMRIGEDAAFLFAVYPRVSGVQLISDKLYRYRLPHSGSIMHGIAYDYVAESLHHLCTSISVFGDWARGGYLEQYGNLLVAWSVKSALYTILRQDPPARDQLASALGDLWKAHWSEGELENMNLPQHTRRLMAHALDTSQPHLSRDLALYRLAEYGVGDIVTTVLEKAKSIR